MRLGNNIFGIDLGTSNIKIYSRNEDAILVEKNMIAIENKNTLFAYGNSAYEMFEKAPSNIHISYPLCNGVIADIQNMQLLVKYFVSDICKGTIRPADYYIAVPTDVTEVEKRAFYDLVKDAGVKARKIMVVEKAVADGLGLDIDVKNSQGVLVVNVGYDTTEISILSLGGIVLSKMIKVGGQKFDEAIRNAIRREYSLLIGGKTAEKVKISLCELECLKEHFATIIDNIKVILERTPPELAADIYRHGVYLTGGASQVMHLAELIAKGTGLKINSIDAPMKSVALGLAKIIKEDNYKSVAYAIEGMSK